MTTERNRTRGDGRPARAADALSGRTVGGLDLPEQFILWALRVRLRDELRGREGPDLARGFFLAFGLARCEPAREAFERAFALLFHGPRRELLLAPPCCACISCDEEELLRLFHPKTPAATRERLARDLVVDALSLTLAAKAASFAELLGRLAAPDTPPGGPAADPDA